MKKLIMGLLVGVTLAPCLALGQGTVIFYNHLPAVGVDSPVYYLSLNNPIWSSTQGRFVAQLWAGTSPEALSPVGNPQPFGTANKGYWDPPTTETAIPNVTPGSSAYFQVWVWTSAFGSSPKTVLPGGAVGSSVVFNTATGGEFTIPGGPPGPPKWLYGLTSIVARPVVPEARVWVMFIAGGLLLGAVRSRGIRHAERV